MMTRCFSRACRQTATLLLSLLVVAACSRKPSLSPAAHSFKEEMQGVMTRLASCLARPLAVDDVKALNAAIEKAHADTARKGNSLAPAVGVADESGVIVAGDATIFPYTTQNYSNISAVEQSLREGKTAQTRLYAPGSERGYLLSCPLAVKGKTVGALLLFFPADTIIEKYGLEEREFLALDFNR